MNNFRTLLTIVPIFFVTACNSATYTIEGKPDPVTGKGPVLQTVAATAPGGDSFVVVVYYGPSIQPTVNAGADASALVDATAAAGAAGLQIVEKALIMIK